VAVVKVSPYNFTGGVYRYETKEANLSEVGFFSFVPFYLNASTVNPIKIRVSPINPTNPGFR
jgi:hypothetical protein